MAEFTPGEWQVAPIRRDDGDAEIYVSRSDPAIQGRSCLSDVTICRVEGGLGRSEKDNRCYESAANAALIAAAPKLFLLAERVLELLDHRLVSGDPIDLIEVIAVRKALNSLLNEVEDLY